MTDLPLGYFPAEILDVSRQAEQVVSLTLAVPAELADQPWHPGAHVEVLIDGEHLRHYSISTPPQHPGAWRIAVLDLPEGRGGSSYMHSLEVGHTIDVAAPRNHFTLDLSSDDYLFVAGGIGITPILSMVEAAEVAGVNWRLLYLGGTRVSMAFLDELAQFGDKVTYLAKSEIGPVDLEPMIDATLAAAGMPRGFTQIYACGPARLLEALESFDLLPGQLHTERFLAGEIEYEDEVGFIVELKDGREIEVAADETIIDAVEAAGVMVASSCREGICGTCVTRVKAGLPDHRDAVLSDEEHASNKVMTVCVSRSLTDRLVLDL